MNERFLKAQMRRTSQLEGATVTSTATPGEPSIMADVSTGGRPARTGVQGLDRLSFYPGEQVLMWAGGDNDAPIILGGNPYIL